MKVAAAFATVYLAWGSTYLAIRYAIETLPPLLMAGVRHLVAGAILYGVARALGAPRPSPRHLLPAAAIGALLLVGGNGGTVLAERHLASGFAALLAASTPLWIAILAGRWSARVFAGVAIGLVGVALLVRPGTAGVHGPSVAILLGGTVAFATGSLYARRATLPESTGVSVGLQMLAGGLLLTLLGAATGEPARVAVVSTRSVAALAYLAVVGSILGYTAFAWLIRVRPANQVATYAYVNPAVAVVLGWALAGEPLHASMLFPAALIVVSVILVLSQKQEAPCDSKPVLCTPVSRVPVSAAR